MAKEASTTLLSTLALNCPETTLCQTNLDTLIQRKKTMHPCVNKKSSGVFVPGCPSDLQCLLAFSFSSLNVLCDYTPWIPVSLSKNPPSLLNLCVGFEDWMNEKNQGQFLGIWREWLASLSPLGWEVKHYQGTDLRQEFTVHMLNFTYSVVGTY